MKPQLLVSAFSNLSTDQRIEKVCDTLYKNGYSIQLIGNNWGGEDPVERPYPVFRIRHWAKTLKLAYPEFQWKLYKELKSRANSNTILLANDLDALLPNVILSKKLNIPLVFDSHEIYTEMPAINGRFTQKIWRWLEKKLVPNIRYMMTESMSYATWFQEKYGVNPLVIRNIPKKILHSQTLDENNPKVIIYQGVINQSRGLPTAILAMKHLDNAILRIAGDGPKGKEYEELVIKEKLQHKVEFIGKLIPNKLREFTKTADVGLSIEENGGVSYLYSLPNKVADYIQARVPVVMINFPEMMRVYQQYTLGEVLESHDEKLLASALQKVLQHGKKHYAEALEKAADDLCWENEEPKILQLFNQVEKENFQ